MSLTWHFLTSPLHMRVSRALDNTPIFTVWKKKTKLYGHSIHLPYSASPTNPVLLLAHPDSSLTRSASITSDECSRPLIAFPYLPSPSLMPLFCHKGKCCTDHVEVNDCNYMKLWHRLSALFGHLCGISPFVRTASYPEPLPPSSLP